MNKFVKENLKSWNEITPLHVRSNFYNVDDFKNGRCTLKYIELEEMGNVSGKSLLHLQCHFGMDTLSWARLGAKATGVDFSDEAIRQACLLSEETNIKANFICSDIYRLPEVLKRKFDIVFTSYGVLCWLPDLNKWAEVISHFLKKGGAFYIVEMHRFLEIFDDSKGATELKAVDSYFHKVEPARWESEGSYAAAGPTVISYEWTHSMGDIINALIGAGLRIDFLHEFPICCYQALPFMVKDETGWWRIKDIDVPLTFSLKATKL